MNHPPAMRPAMRSNPVEAPEPPEERVRIVATGVPLWFQGIAAGALLALIGVVWNTTTNRIAALEARADQSAREAADARAEAAARKAEFAAMKDTLTRMDARLDRIDAHLEQLAAAPPRKDRP